MSQRQVVLLLLLLVAPTALGHGSESHLDQPANHPDSPRSAPTRPSQPADTGTLPSGYTGPGTEPYRSFFEGTWLYGQASVTPLDGQVPVDMDADGDWVVWEDSRRSDIYAFSVKAGQGYYLTNDSAMQRFPRVSNGIVVWEDYRASNRSAVWMYDLATSETRRISGRSGEAVKPQTDGTIVAWTWLDDDRTDVHAYTLANSTEWAVASSDDREQDPFVVGGKVYWRAIRFNIWDILGFDVQANETFTATNDRYIQSPPFGNETGVSFLTQQALGGWKLHTYDPVGQTDVETKWALPSSKPVSMSRDHMILIARDVRYHQLVVRNLSNSVTTHVSGNLVLVTDPVISDEHVYAVVRTAQGVRLLDLAVSPFAFAPPPTLTVLTDTSFPWMQPMRVAGRLEAGPAWTAPLTFTYRVNGGTPQPIPPNTTWAFTLDNAGVPKGYHTVTIRATFREGPPVSQSFVLMVPQTFKGVDLPQTASAYHEAIVMGLARHYVLDNPGSWVLIPIVALLVAILLFRLWLSRASRPRRVRRKREPEYVRPDET